MFITAGPIIKLCVGGRRGTVEEMFMQQASRLCCPSRALEEFLPVSQIKDAAAKLNLKFQDLKFQDPAALDKHDANELVMAPSRCWS